MCPVLHAGTVKTQPLKPEIHFRFIFPSEKYKTEWQRSQSSCVICIFSPTKVSAAYSSCWEAPKQHVKDGHKVQGCYSKSGSVGERWRLSGERLLLASSIGLYLKNGLLLVAPENWNSACGNSEFIEKEKCASGLLPAKGETQQCCLGTCVLLCDSGLIRPGLEGALSFLLFQPSWVSGIPVCCLHHKVWPQITQLFLCKLVSLPSSEPACYSFPDAK